MEKREYTRLSTDISACIFLCEGEEIGATILNVSEEGFKCLIKKPDYEKIKPINVGDYITIQFIDTVSSLKKQTDYILSCTARIRHIESDAVSFVFGCKTNSQEFYNYVSHKKCARYFLMYQSNKIGKRSR